MPTTASPLAEALRKQLRLRPGESLYTIVDAAQDKELAFEAETRFGLPIRMLFQGEAAQYMGDVAPYFIPIDPEGEYLDRWAASWGKNAGILLTSFADPDTLFRHLREIFVVKDEEGQEYFFRYYDPRVLRVFLPTCSPEEALKFFGPVRLTLTEAEEPAAILKFDLDKEVIRRAIVKLSPT
jgi:hypothetical protein